AYETGQPAQGRIGSRLVRRQIKDFGTVSGDDQHLTMGDGGNDNADGRPLMRLLMVCCRGRRGREDRDGSCQAASPSANARVLARLPHRSSFNETSAAR